MKLTLKDFGPIDEFTLDLSKDIQFIYGENSVGKSYAVFVLYALVKALQKGVHLESLKDSRTLHDFQHDLLKMVTESKKTNHDITEKIISIIQTILTEYFAREFAANLLTKSESISKFDNQKTKKNFQINLDLDMFTFIITSSGLNQVQIIVDSESKIMASYNEEAGEINIYTNDFNRLKFTLEQLDSFGYRQNFSAWMTLLPLALLQLSNNMSAIHSIPANRVGIYLGMNSFSSVIAELSKNRSFLQNNKSINLPMLSIDAADYFINISTMDTQNKNEDLSSFTKKIEDTILDGQVNFDNKRNRIVYRPKNLDLDLDLSQTSSMIAEISIIVAFFKYILEKREKDIDEFTYKQRGKFLVIIEEPEAHLHPKTQVALMEIFAELPKYGVKLIVTSHSDFMFTKLGNMIIEGKIDHNTVGTYHMKMGEKGSYDAEDMKPTKDGVKDHNFVEVSEKLYEERVDIYDRLNEQNAPGYNKK